MKRLRGLFLLALGALTLASCTLVTTNPAPETIRSSQVPFGLLHKTIPGTNGARVRFVTQAIFIVDAAKRLAPASRIVPAPPSLATVIGQLLLGPTAIEESAGFSSALPEKTVLISATLRNGVAYLDFATPLTTLSKSDRLLAAGELALTAAEVGARNGVVISVAGTTQSLPLPNGKEATRVSAQDYLSLLNT